MKRNRILLHLICVVILTMATINTMAKELYITSDKSLKITVIYDNYDFKEGLRSEWGFSCLIQSGNSTVLFDTGGKANVFKSNFNALGIDAANIESLILSHDHWDHISGTCEFLKMNNNVDVYVTPYFSEDIKTKIEGYNARLKACNNPCEIHPNIFLSGIFTHNMEEQAVIVHTNKGLVVVTGCSHPGIVNMLTQIKSTFKKDIYMVIGGFHLLRNSDAEVKQIIKEIKKIGVEKCGATHCTGDKQIDLFRKAFGENFVEMGVGRVITVN